MKPKHLMIAASLITIVDRRRVEPARGEARQGKLSHLVRSQSAAEFDRGVAMLYSYWFNYARRTFEGVLQKDPSCAIAKVVSAPAG
jgi:hypothetical protein